MEINKPQKRRTRSSIYCNVNESKTLDGDHARFKSYLVLWVCDLWAGVSPWVSYNLSIFPRFQFRALSEGFSLRIRERHCLQEARTAFWPDKLMKLPAGWVVCNSGFVYDEACEHLPRYKY